MNDASNLERSHHQDRPDRVRRRIAADHAGALADASASADDRPGRWCVFETIAADGSLAIGVAVAPDPSTVMIVYAHLSELVAKRGAAGLAAWYRAQGRNSA